MARAAGGWVGLPEFPRQTRQKRLLSPVSVCGELNLLSNATQAIRTLTSLAKSGGWPMSLRLQCSFHHPARVILENAAESVQRVAPAKPVLEIFA